MRVEFHKVFMKNSFHSMEQKIHEIQKIESSTKENTQILEEFKPLCVDFNKMFFAQTQYQYHEN
jgi:endonuclease III-like uncharacterized protein